MLIRNGIPLDPNFHLNNNVLNPIRTFIKKERFQAFGDLTFSLGCCLAVSFGIAIGTFGSLF